MSKTLGITVSADTFGEDFQDKLNKALVGAFGETTKVAFADPAAGNGGNGGDSELSAEEKKKKEEEMMAKDKKMTELMAELERYKAKEKYDDDTKKQIADFEGKIKELKEGLQKSKDAEKKMGEDFSKYKEDIRQKEIDSIITNGEKEGKIIPANRETIKAMLVNADVGKIVKFTQGDKTIEKTQWELVVDHIKGLPKVVVYREMGGGAGAGPGGGSDFATEVKIGNDTFTVDDAELAAQAEKYAQDNKVSYDVALIKVSGQKRG